MITTTEETRPATHAPVSAEAARTAWALAHRDSEREAWERLYDTPHPRPATLVPATAVA
jgi:hypothetical protein